MSHKGPHCAQCTLAVKDEHAFVTYACDTRHVVHMECAHGAQTCPACTTTRLEEGGLITEETANGGGNMDGARHWVRCMRESRGGRPVSTHEALHRLSFVHRCCMEGAPGAYREDGAFEAVSPRPQLVAELAAELTDSRSRGEVLSIKECFTGRVRSEPGLHTGTHHLHAHASETARETHLLQTFAMLKARPTPQELIALRVTFVVLRAVVHRVLFKGRARPPTVLELHAYTRLRVEDLISLGASWADLVGADLKSAVALRGEDEVAPVLSYVSLKARDARGRALYEMLLTDVFSGSLEGMLATPFTAADFLLMGFTPEAFSRSRHAKFATHAAWAALGARMSPAQFIGEWGWGSATINRMICRAAGGDPPGTISARVSAFYAQTMRWSPNAVKNARAKGKEAQQ